MLLDFDALEEANESTGLLTTLSDVGEKKTPAMARWCERRGFRTSIVERSFQAGFHVQDNEPRFALVGLDNTASRADLEHAGFARIFEACLGKGPEEYLTFQAHTLPGSRSARMIWGDPRSGQAAVTDLLARPGYEAMLEEGMEECGVMQLAG